MGFSGPSNADGIESYAFADGVAGIKLTAQNVRRWNACPGKVGGKPLVDGTRNIADTARFVKVFLDENMPASYGRIWRVIQVFGENHNRNRLRLNAELVFDRQNVRLELAEAGRVQFRVVVGFLIPARLPDQEFERHYDIRIGMFQVFGRTNSFGLRDA
jgi:hypothetical protein